MSSNLSAINPLSYMGVRPVKPAPVYFKTRAPTTDDLKNFIISTIWIDTDAQNAYMMVDNSAGVATWLNLGTGSSGIQTVTTPDANVVTPVSNNINIVNGAGIAVTGSGDDITITATATPFIITWSVITAATKTIVVNEGYFANKKAGVAFTLPATAAVGDVFYVSAIDAGGWTIGQSIGQSIRLGSSVTTTGGGGSLASTAIGDSVFVVCAVANTDFVAVSGCGNITVV